MNRAEMTAAIVSRLDCVSEQARTAWQNIGPRTSTRHCTIDNLLPGEVASEIAAAFPRDGTGFNQRDSFRERKMTSTSLDELKPILADIAFSLQSPPVMEKIAAIIGMDGLEPDPRLYAGGLSMMFRGDFLNPHIDNSHEATKTKYRRVNLLYYASPNAKHLRGGNLELWDRNVRHPVTIVSEFNRLVLMETNRTSWHSVSPVKSVGPRCCVSSYYFSKQSPTGDDYYHVTSFTGRPGQPFRRMLGTIDNAARNLARRLGAKRASDKGYSGNLLQG